MLPLWQRMINEFLQTKREFSLAEGKEEVVKRKPPRVVMDHPQLSLGPCLSNFESEASPCRKRKHTWDETFTQANIELHLNDPLPLDWEQCLDLQSGRMYYLNRKSLKKSWSRPKEDKLDLELNISTTPSSEWRPASAVTTQEGSTKQSHSSGNMVAVVCLNCHLLVMLCRSSPLCPNCKYVHSLPKQQPLPARLIEQAARPLETLSLLN